MRTCTILFSIVAHAVVVFAAFVVSVTATDTLPEPRWAEETVLVPAQLPPAPPRPAARTRPPETSAPTPNAAPLVAQDGITPEHEQPLIDDVPAPDSAVGAGLTPATTIVDAPPQPPQPPQPRGPIPVGGDIRPPVKIRHVAPEYPTIALNARVTGIVILEAVIGDDGSVDAVKVLRGHPLLDQAAVDAVRQWGFTPTLLNGQPVPVVMTVTVSFSLPGR